ncbi:MAG: flagellar motor switch protein FliN [Oscillospiraceae bacterium]
MISGGLNYEVESNSSDFALSEFEADTIGEVLNISMGSAATAISSLLERKVLITTPKVSTAAVSTIEYSGFEPAMCVEITYVEGISGSNVMVFKQEDMALILDVLMGREPGESGENFEFDEIAISAACEVMNQMMGASATALSNFLGMPINISTPNAILQDRVDIAKNLSVSDDEYVTLVKFDLQIEGVTTTEFVSIMSISLTKEIIGRMTGEYQEPEKAVVAEKPSQPIAPPPPPPMPTIEQLPSMPSMLVPDIMPQMQEMPQMQQMPQMQAMPQMQQMPQMQAMPQMQQMPQMQAMPQMPQMQQMQQPMMYGGMAPMQVSPVNAKNVVLEPLNGGINLEGENLSNLEMIMSVPMQVSVEIGRTQKRIKEILDFTQGTIVELDKQAGAPVDIIVNGQPVARGDVVVIDDNFAVRITEILKTKDLLEKI